MSKTCYGLVIWNNFPVTDLVLQGSSLSYGVNLCTCTMLEWSGILPNGHTYLMNLTVLSLAETETGMLLNQTQNKAFTVTFNEPFHTKFS